MRGSRFARSGRTEALDPHLQFWYSCIPGSRQAPRLIPGRTDPPHFCSILPPSNPSQRVCFCRKESVKIYQGIMMDAGFNYYLTLPQGDWIKKNFYWNLSGAMFIAKQMTL